MASLSQERRQGTPVDNHCTRKHRETNLSTHAHAATGASTETAPEAVDATANAAATPAKAATPTMAGIAEALFAS